MKVQLIIEAQHEEDHYDIEYILEQVVQMPVAPAIGDILYLGDGVSPKWGGSRWCESATVKEVCHIVFLDDQTHLGEVSITAVADHLHE